MCGIVACSGGEGIVDFLVDGLRRLEYRGYDSVGVAAVGEGTLTVAKTPGRLADLAPRLSHGLDSPFTRARAGIGHTRWATHGEPSEANAHPHVDCGGRVAIVHNGIIENFRDLRARLAADGHLLVSETDSELLAHLIEEADDQDLERAVAHALGCVRGSFALAVVSVDHPDRVVVARQESPLVVARNDDRAVAASDLTATLSVDRETWVLDDGALAVLEPGGFSVRPWNGGRAGVTSVLVDWDPGVAERGGFETFMAKEIHEQPEAVTAVLRGRDRIGELDLEGALDLAAVDEVVLVGCGTSAHACLAGEVIIEEWAGLPARTVLASEYRTRAMPLRPGMLVIALSQSGETADTLAAARLARERGAPVLAVTNTQGSRLSREADAVLYTRAGPEVSVAATKTFTVQLVALARLGLEIAAARVDGRGGSDPEGLLARLLGLPEVVEAALRRSSAVEAWAEAFDHSAAMYLGRGIAYAIALEGALKLKEIAYVHAHGYAAGEMKHGPIALVETGIPVVGVVAPGPAGEKTLGNLEEVAARGAEVFVIAPRGFEGAPFASTLEVPATDPLAFAVAATIPLQVLAHRVARRRGIDPDRPRNLAKSVTVE